MKRIRLKKRYRLKVDNVLILVMVLFISIICIDYFKDIKFFSSNEDYIKNILFNINSYKFNKSNSLSKVTNIIFSSNVKNPISIIQSTFNYKSNEKDEEYNPDLLEGVTKHIEDPNPKDIKEPLIYIYNSHQLENYSNDNKESYSVTPNVMTASYILREKLRNLGIESVVEEADITEFIRLNNWNYNYSYLASRYYINDAKERYKSIKYFIDIHRDSLTKDKSTVRINDKLYASILFVIGLEHSNYQKNLDFAYTLNNKLNNKYPNISKGILKKEGPNVNGIYNQDLDPNLILIEIGGYENTIEEVDNTMDALSIILKEYINEHK